MTFDILCDQPLDVRSHRYINRKPETPHWLFNVSFGEYHYMGLVRSLGICCTLVWM